MISHKLTSLLAFLCASLWCAVATAQPAQPAQPAPARKPLPAPPSTGREMPKKERPDLTPQQAVEKVGEAMKLAARDSECAQVTVRLERALPYATTLPMADGIKALRTLQRCAIKSKRWKAVMLATTGLLQLAPEQASPDELVRAMVELGQYDRAAAMLKTLVKKFPKAANELTTAATLLLCRQELWAACAKTGKAALAALERGGVAQDSEAMLKNRTLYATALIGIGDLEGYQAQRQVLQTAMQPKMAAALKTLLERFDSDARAAAQQRMWMRVTTAKMLPLGTYHLMGKPETGVMATVRMQNHDRRERSFRLETEVQGATERAVTNFKLGRGKALQMTATPPLSLSFDVGKIRATRPAQLAVRLVETTGGKEQSLVDETFAVDVLPRDYLPLKRTIGGDYPIWTLEYVAAWITPNIKPVEELLSKAKQRVAKRRFAGEQTHTLEQVKAIYDELQARGVSYVMDPDVNVESLMTQRIRLPGEILSSTNAQCLEGTLLFATLLESIGLRPLVVTVPGHAFVGWYTVAADKQPKQVFLETTLVGTASFEDAVAVATSRVIEEQKKGNLDNGVVQIVDVAGLRRRGYTAQPYE